MLCFKGLWELLNENNVEAKKTIFFKLVKIQQYIHQSTGLDERIPKMVSFAPIGFIFGKFLLKNHSLVIIAFQSIELRKTRPCSFESPSLKT